MSLDLSRVPCVICIKNSDLLERSVKIANSSSNFILMPGSAVHIRAQTSSEVLSYLMQGDSLLLVHIFEEGTAPSGLLLDSQTGNLIINSLTGNFVVEEC